MEALKPLVAAPELMPELVPAMKTGPAIEPVPTIRSPPTANAYLQFFRRSNGRNDARQDASSVTFLTGASGSADAPGVLESVSRGVEPEGAASKGRLLPFGPLPGVAAGQPVAYRLRTLNTG